MPPTRYAHMYLLNTLSRGKANIFCPDHGPTTMMSEITHYVKVGSGKLKNNNKINIYNSLVFFTHSGFQQTKFVRMPA